MKVWIIVLVSLLSMGCSTSKVPTGSLSASPASAPISEKHRREIKHFKEDFGTLLTTVEDFSKKRAWTSSGFDTDKALGLTRSATDLAGQIKRAYRNSEAEDEIAEVCDSFERSCLSLKARLALQYTGVAARLPDAEAQKANLDKDIESSFKQTRDLYDKLGARASRP